MKRMLAIVLLLSLAVTMPDRLPGAEKKPIQLRVPMTAVVVPVAQPAPQPVPLVVPVGEIAEIVVTEMDATMARLCDTTIYPRPEGLWVRKVTDWENKEYTIQLRSPVASKFLVKIVSPGLTINDPVQAAEVELTVGEAPTPIGAPVITSPLTSSGSVGVAYSYATTATNSPTSYAATGLLEGLTLDTKSGLITGTPTAAGTSAVKLSATNAQGMGSAVLALTITDAPLPPPIPTAPTLILITATGKWCDACEAVKADTLPGLQSILGNRLSVVDYASDVAKKEYGSSALVPRWVLKRPNGKVEKKIGYQTLEQITAWMEVSK